MESETRFESPQERLQAMAAYYGLCSWMDHNVGQILQALEDAGMTDNTTIIYTSDHGDNVGSRGLWGKSNFYQESVHIPMIMAGPDVAVGTCNTPVSLVDLSKSIAHHFGADIDAATGTLPLVEIANRPDDPERIIFSEYHAVGAVSGGFMLRKGQWKLNYYVDFAPELFDLENDPEELVDLASNPEYAAILSELELALRDICDPEEMSNLAFEDQAALIERNGGRTVAMTLGAPGATPPPATGE